MTDAGGNAQCTLVVTEALGLEPLAAKFAVTPTTCPRPTPRRRRVRLRLARPVVLGNQTVAAATPDDDGHLVEPFLVVPQQHERRSRAERLQGLRGDADSGNTDGGGLDVPAGQQPEPVYDVPSYMGGVGPSGVTRKGSTSPETSSRSSSSRPTWATGLRPDTRGQCSARRDVLRLASPEHWRGGIAGPAANAQALAARRCRIAARSAWRSPAVLVQPAEVGAKHHEQFGGRRRRDRGAALAIREHRYSPKKSPGPSPQRQAPSAVTVAVPARTKNE